MTPDNILNARRAAPIVAATIGLASALLPAAAQQDGSSSVFELNPLVTVANRYELPLNRVGSSVEYISSYDLELTHQSFALEAIRTTPGFHVRNNGGPGGAFGITTRGLNGTRPIVLIDGIEVSNPASGRIINFGNLFGSNIESIEILKGAQSSLYGADATAGVISIATKAEGGKAELSYGSFNTIQSSIAQSGNQGAFSWSINAGRYSSDGFSSQDPDSLGEDFAQHRPAYQDDDGYENTNFATKLAYRISDSSDVYLVSYYLKSHSEFDPGNPAWIFGDANADNYSDDENLFSRVGGSFKVLSNWKAEASLAYSNVNSSSFSGTAFPSNGDRYAFDWKNTLELNESWNVVAGLQYEIEDNRSSTGDRDNRSVFVENIFALNEALDLTLGARHDRNSEYGNETTWRSSFSYRIDQAALRVHGSYGTSFQAPTFYQLNSSYGNPELAPETGESWDLGVEKTLADGKLFLSSTAFSYDIANKIDFSYATFRYANEGTYQSKGLETSARLQVSRELDFTLGHTYSDAQYANLREAERVPRNVYSLASNWRVLNDRLNLNATVYSLSSQFSTQSSASKQPGYTLVNLASQYELNESAQLWLRVDNLFDKDYEEIESYQTAGQSFYGGVRYTF